MEGIDFELIQFFKEQARSYDFLLHRTKKEADAMSILENGLYFESDLHKVTDAIKDPSPLALMGNKMFFGPYGQFIVIIAIPKSLRGQHHHLAHSVPKEELKGLFAESDIVEFEDVHHLPAQYVMAYNVSFGRKLKFNRRFLEYSYLGAA